MSGPREIKMDKRMKFSGDKEKFESGATREAKRGRGLPALIYPGLMIRLSKWLETGAENHEPRNWEQGIPSESYLNSLYRHVISYHAGDRSEDHLAAMLFNVQGLLFNEEMIEQELLPKELDNLPNYLAKKEPQKSSAIVTFSGKTFDPVKPDSDALDILDIGRALSRQCRFTGHTRDFYSVAQHCVLAAWWAEEDRCSVLERLAILLHDAAEAYMNDIAKPVKQVLSNYLKIEQNLKHIIYHKYLGTQHCLALENVVKKYDQKMMALEIHKLMPESKVYEPWLIGDYILQSHEFDKFSEYNCFAPTWTPNEAFDYFIVEFDFLTALLSNWGK